MSGAMALRPLVVIPAYNEAANIQSVLQRLRSCFPRLDCVVIDDGSTDETAARARSMGVDVVRLPCNLGYGGAVQTGFRYAVGRGYDAVILMDADGQHDPGEISALLKPLAAGRADVVLGSRFLGEHTYAIEPVRRLAMRFFSGVVWRLTGQRITDPTSGFQALSREAVRFFAYDHYPSDFPDADTLLLLLYAGFRVMEVPVTMHERLSGRSMHSLFGGIYYVLRMSLSLFILLLRQKTQAMARRPDVLAERGGGRMRVEKRGRA